MPYGSAIQAADQISVSIRKTVSHWIRSFFVYALYPKDTAPMTDIFLIMLLYSAAYCHQVYLISE